MLKIRNKGTNHNRSNGRTCHTEIKKNYLQKEIMKPSKNVKAMKQKRRCTLLLTDKELMDRIIKKLYKHKITIVRQLKYAKYFRHYTKQNSNGQ